MADACSLTALPSDFGEHFLPYKCSLRQRILARKFANESYIESVRLNRGQSDGINVMAKIYRSQKKNDAPHRIDATIQRNTISDANCSCKAGVSGECSHVLALILKLTDWILEGLQDVPSQPASTSLPQQWDRPRGTKILPEPVSTMVVSRPGNTNRKKRPLTTDFTDNRKIQLVEKDIRVLQSLKGTGLGYISCQPFQTVQTAQGPQNIGSTLAHQIPLIQPPHEPGIHSFPCTDVNYPVVPSVRNLAIVNDYKEKLQSVSISIEEAQALEANTRNQADNDNWHKERQKRITASNFGRIMLRKSSMSKRCADSIKNAKVFSSCATSYGTANEKVAKNMYRKQTGNHVHDCGFVVNPAFPFIGASPDGKVCSKGESGILEIKCPFTIRDMKVLDAISANMRSDFFLELIGENVQLKRNHAYWYQVQGQLLVTGAAFCDFVTFTRQDLIVLRILPNIHDMEAILSRMLDVYGKFW